MGLDGIGDLLKYKAENGKGSPVHCISKQYNHNEPNMSMFESSLSRSFFGWSWLLWHFSNTKVWGPIYTPIVILKYLITGIEIKKVTQYI